MHSFCPMYYFLCFYHFKIGKKRYVITRHAVKIIVHCPFVCKCSLCSNDFHSIPTRPFQEQAIGFSIYRTADRWMGCEVIKVENLWQPRVSCLSLDRFALACDFVGTTYYLLPISILVGGPLDSHGPRFQ